MLTETMQENFYINEICNRKSDHRFWAVLDDLVFIGMVGLVNISLENRNAEISIVIDPEIRQAGKGREALELLLDKGFNEINLDSIYGECYENNKSISFWNKMIAKYNGTHTKLKARKYCNGQYYDSLYFTFLKKHWRAK
jgi:RimJ/RimL family protein N-acetyltransferase